MPDFPQSTAGVDRRDVRRTGRPAAHGIYPQSRMRALHLSISLLPTAVMGFLGLAAVAVLYDGTVVSRGMRLELVVAAAGAVITLGAALVAAEAATRQLRRQRTESVLRDQEYTQGRLGELGFLIVQGRQDLQRLAERLRAGGTAALSGEDFPPPAGADPYLQLVHELRKAQSAAWNAVVGAASREAASGSSQRVAVFVNLARRLQSLSHRAIQGLDELENQVEDPDLLKGLFRVDHLSTRMRRQAESLAVIGGAAPRRRWTKPVTVYEVLRSAIAEVEHYHRVKVVPPVEGSLNGGAVADVIHLLAELVENATKFSPPQTQVFIRFERVTAGMAIEVEDRGLGIPQEDQRRLNALLADPERADTEELLKDGRIGLLVVAALAHRHRVRVQLRGNVYGGTQAIVVVPKELDGGEAEESETGPQAEPVAAAAAPPAASLPNPQPARASGSGQGVQSRPGPPLDGRDALGAPMPPQPPSAAENSQRRPSPPPASGAPAAAQDSRTAPDPLTAPAFPGDAGERPPLPQRQAQASLAPELLNAPAFEQDDQEVEYNTGFMAAFKKGLRSAEENDGPAEDLDRAN
ncbi:ATP-binding protein [Actinomadura sp. RB99]|uniref:sensor histidine kinase n=1 Tax=Actinomadura sp. RB99 TaxID=2691577 RepID=UPI0016862AE0|nr:ATP-binding protein [Actinomadura sp. RB99]